MWADALRRLSRNRAAMLGLLVVLFYVLLAIFAPLIARKNPVEQTSGNSLRPPVWVTDNPKRMPNPENLFGTDTNGRDILSRLIYGVRVSLIVGLVPQLIIVTVGITIGLISGFAGGWLDNLLMRITEIVAAFPDLLFIITLTVAFRETTFGKAFNGLLLIFTALAAVGWTGMARLVRGQVLSLKEKEFIEAARALGIPIPTILFRHILPNTMAPIIVAISFSIPGLILAEAILTFLGVGMRPSVDPTNGLPTSLGQMMSDGFSNLSSGPWMLLFPVVMISTLVLSFTFLGDGLRDALDPRDSG
ncbi:binding-protein-dependent transport systems inner membrane component [Oscillochloris trichoides DG-6]|uniref:Binding-protein-dependent transport systems inner membrane component n=1 Tax=Oscillochloris trichoides DG-6 TaxID=765420 RepID=E1IB85_9CHLR|nr:binding-protein-dependent transport systems inner membrane component [Oscillochloris trichoides DG-6]